MDDTAETCVRLRSNNAVHDGWMCFCLHHLLKFQRSLGHRQEDACIVKAAFPGHREASASGETQLRGTRKNLIQYGAINTCNCQNAVSVFS